MTRVELARALLAPRRYVLYFSHMRSYSSLVGHILGSHPEVAGYAELHQHYDSPTDLVRLRYRVWEINDGELRGRFVFDKVLHGGHRIDDTVLLRRDVVPIYAVREPLASVRSQIAMGMRRTPPSPNKTPPGAARHIINRYQHIRELARRRPAAAAMFTDSIVDEPEQTLKQLARYVGLRTPLRRQYRTFEKTGRPHFGDPVGPIGAGDIVAKRPEHLEIELEHSLHDRLVDAYESVVETLLACETVIGSPVAFPTRRTNPESRRVRQRANSS
jgi:hypothetical protein